MLIAIFWPGTKKQARVAFIISLAVYLVVWAIIGIAFLAEQNKLNSWNKVEATITGYQQDTLETKYSYEVDSKTYTKSKTGLLYKGRIGDKNTLLCPPNDNPKNCIFELELTKTSGVTIFAEVWLVFSLFPILYGICYIYQNKKEVKQVKASAKE